MGEWKKVKLGDCIKEVVEKTTENNQHQVLSVTKDGIFSQEEFFKKQIASENNIGYKVIRRNNLVFSTMNLWMGSLDVLTNYDIGIVSPAYKIFKFNEELMLPSYGNYFMKSYYMLEQYKNCSEQGASVVRRNLNLKALLNIVLFIPSIDEQKKIVSILKKIDKIILSTNLEYKKLFSLKKKYLNSVFDLNNENEYKFKKTKLLDVLEIPITDGPHETPILVKEGIPFISADSIKNGKIDFSRKRGFITKEYNDQCNKKYSPKVNDIYMIKSGATTGKVALVETNIEFNIWSPLAAIRVNEKNYYKYLYYMLESEFIQKQVRKKSSDGTQPNLSMRVLEKFNILITDKENQIKIAKIFETFDCILNKINAKQQEYEILKKALMQNLLTGKVKIKI